MVYQLTEPKIVRTDAAKSEMEEGELNKVKKADAQLRWDHNAEFDGGVEEINPNLESRFGALPTAGKMRAFWIKKAVATPVPKDEAYTT